jgi:glycerol-3-phosphate dehydrogenase
MQRSAKWDRLQNGCEVLVIGGGATGLGIAVDAVTRGFRTVLVEAGDFAQATSSRATKLVHGGVRYLANGQIHLVYEALRERRVMLQNAPHLVHRLGFVTPAYRWMDLPFYGTGLKMYDVLSGGSSLGATHLLSAKKTTVEVPGINPDGLKGSVQYFDGQFDDARFALALARTAEDHGAVVMNYVRCTRLVQKNGRVCGAILQDVEAGQETEIAAGVVVNAGGIFLDAVRRMDDAECKPLLKTSRGTHIVVAGSVLGGSSALMIPKTRDGRLIFAIPWMGKCVIGTTDIPAESVAMEPGHSAKEIAFLMETISPYLAKPITDSEILSVFSGLRPLVTGEAASTAKLSREHHLAASTSGLITIAGGKWTTYRRMAADTLDFDERPGLLEKRPCRTETVPLRGAPATDVADGPLARYGADAAAIEQLQREHPEWGLPLDSRLPFTAAEVIYAVREEMARTVEDVLSRRMRALLLDARAATACAGQVAALLAAELDKDAVWATEQERAFTRLAEQFYTR